jgi:hypothetical protein
MDHNTQMLDGFLGILKSKNTGVRKDFDLENGHAVGPIFVSNCPAAEAFKIPSDIPLFVGKIRTNRFANGGRGCDGST